MQPLPPWLHGIAAGGSGVMLEVYYVRCSVLFITKPHSKIFAKPHICRCLPAKKFERKCINMEIGPLSNSTQGLLYWKRQFPGLCPTSVLSKQIARFSAFALMLSQMNKMADAVRNSREQVNALQTSKKLLRNELTDVTQARDKLMCDINALKKVN